MVKKRLVFTLLYQDGGFYLSRNFRLQRIGDLAWLQNNYRFSEIATAIDELVILDVTRGNRRDLEAFCAVADRVSENCFMPLVLGGGISCLQDAEAMINSGADKIIINTALTRDPCLVRELVRVYGSQCIIASVDFRLEGGAFVPYTQCGTDRIMLDFVSYISSLIHLQVGELYINSIDRDGTGQGYCLEVLDLITEFCRLPVTIAGGAGNRHHLLSGLKHSKVDAVATANLLNFIGDGLPAARRHLLSNLTCLAVW